MKLSSLTLRPLRPSDEPSFRAALAEVRAEEKPWDFALGWDDALDFATYLRRLEDWSRGKNLPSGHVPANFYVGVVDGEVVGRVSLRHTLNDFLAAVGGHIGYGVRPTQRRRGYASEMLRQTLPFCAALGLKRVLLTCDTDNVGSRKVIEQGGGVFERITNLPALTVQKRHYWIRIGK